MIAEIHNKISQHGSNLNDKLEDQLTGNVFGSLRYLPFSHVLIPILRMSVYKEQDQFRIESFEHKLQNTKEYEATYHFWPKREQGEIDLIIETDELVIGIEVKFLSGLSSDDNINNSEQGEWLQSSNQLARYVKILKDWDPNKQDVLLFLAPTSLGVVTYQDILSRHLIEKNTLFGLLTWEDVLTALNQLQKPYRQDGETLIIQDLIQLLDKKGFSRFEGFNLPNSSTINKDHFFSYHHSIDYSRYTINKEGFYQYGN